MAANGISTLTIASGTTLTKNVNPPHTNAEIVPPYSAIWSLNYVGALGATNDVSYKLYVTSLGIGSAVTLTSHQTGDYAVTAGNFLYDEYGNSIGILKGNTTIDNYMAKAAAVCGSLSNTIITAATYKGTWNAFTNTPTLTNGVGTLGDAYDTTVTGTSGAFPAYSEQDWRIYDGSVWQRVAKTTTTQWTITPATGGLADKEARQIAKLTIAEAKRQGKVVAADGTITGSLDATKPYYRANNTYSLTLLPDTYATNADDNANTSGLLQGRPWYDTNTEAFYDGEVLEVSPGIWRTNYQGYHNEVPNFFDTAVLKAAPDNFDAADNDINEPALPNSTSMMLKGYLRVTYTGNYTIYLSCDDGAYLWFGDNAITNWRSGNTLTNVTISNGGLHPQTEVSTTVALTAGTYIPLRVMFGNGPDGPGVLVVSYSYPGQAKTSDFTGKIFYRTSTNGF